MHNIIVLQFCAYYQRKGEVLLFAGMYVCEYQSPLSKERRVHEWLGTRLRTGRPEFYSWCESQSLALMEIVSPHESMNLLCSCKVKERQGEPGNECPDIILMPTSYHPLQTAKKLHFCSSLYIHCMPVMSVTERWSRDVYMQHIVGYGTLVEQCYFLYFYWSPSQATWYAECHWVWDYHVIAYVIMTRSAGECP